MEPELICKQVTIKMNKYFVEFVGENIYKGNIMPISGIDDGNDDMDNIWTSNKCLFMVNLKVVVY